MTSAVESTIGGEKEVVREVPGVYWHFKKSISHHHQHPDIQFRTL